MGCSAARHHSSANQRMLQDFQEAHGAGHGLDAPEMVWMAFRGVAQGLRSTSDGIRTGGRVARASADNSDCSDAEVGWGSSADRAAGRAAANLGASTQAHCSCMEEDNGAQLYNWASKDRSP